jgi:hypothetical protein
MFKRNGLLLGLGFLASLASTQAATIPCPTGGTLAALVALGSSAANGCTVSDKVFYNFSYTALDGNAPAATAINASLDNSPAILLSGFTFTVLGSVFAGNFSLGYSVAVVPAVCATCAITSVEEQMFAGPVPPSALSISIAESAGGTPTIINNSSLAANTGGDSFSGVPTLTKLATSSAITSADPLVSFESDIRETNTPITGSPEPATLSLIGLGLIGFGWIRRSARG